MRSTRGAAVIAWVACCCHLNEATRLAWPSLSYIPILGKESDVPGLEKRGRTRLFLDTVRWAWGHGRWPYRLLSTQPFDQADVKACEELLPLGIFHGVTCNPAMLGWVCYLGQDGQMGPLTSRVQWIR
eukprot:Skav208700  [mRNA]  locus=scaffold42:310120:312735:+ [translate_table: standard]